MTQWFSHPRSEFRFRSPTRGRNSDFALPPKVEKSNLAPRFRPRPKKPSPGHRRATCVPYACHTRAIPYACNMRAICVPHARKSHRRAIAGPSSHRCAPNARRTRAAPLPNACGGYTASTVCLPRQEKSTKGHVFARRRWSVVSPSPLRLRRRPVVAPSLLRRRLVVDPPSCCRQPASSVAASSTLINAKCENISCCTSVAAVRPSSARRVAS